MTKQLEYLDKLKQLRKDAPKPFGLYSATCIGLDGGLGYYLQNFQDSNFIDFSSGLKAYRNTDYVPQRTPCKLVKQKGRVKLFEYSEQGDPILLVPSMVNKNYIFDLYEDNSFIKHLISEGYRPYIIDWDEPYEDSEKINLQSLVEDYILYFSEFLNNELNEKIHLLGYCMGGVFTLISALKQQNLYKSLTLVATPFDFNEMPFTGMMKFYKSFNLEYLKTSNVSAEVIQSLFFMLDCKGVLSRIKKFAKIKNEEQMKRMVALEDWLSDCIDFENTMAVDILNLWYGENRIYHEELDYSKFKLKTYLVTASNDGIVPRKSSLPLLDKITNVEHMPVRSGHVGIMAGRRSIDDFYKKISKKLKNI